MDSECLDGICPVRLRSGGNDGDAGCAELRNVLYAHGSILCAGVSGGLQHAGHPQVTYYALLAQPYVTYYAPVGQPYVAYYDVFQPKWHSG